MKSGYLPATTGSYNYFVRQLLEERKHLLLARARTARKASWYHFRHAHTFQGGAAFSIARVRSRLTVPAWLVTPKGLLAP